MTPTSRSLAHLKKQGALVRIVEHWNPWAKIRQDLWGFDLIAVGECPGGCTGAYHEELSLIQVTSDSNHAARRKKVLALASTARLKNAGVRLLIHSWGQKGGRGEKKKWKLREEQL